jgi:hypothetical protein
MTRVSVHPDLLRWARERARLSALELEARFPKLPQWESGETEPTLNQLEHYARTTHTPIGYLVLPSPPKEKLPIPDLRTMGGRAVERPSPDLLETVSAGPMSAKPKPLSSRRKRAIPAARRSRSSSLKTSRRSYTAPKHSERSGACTFSIRSKESHLARLPSNRRGVAHASAPASKTHGSAICVRRHCPMRNAKVFRSKKCVTRPVTCRSRRPRSTCAVSK